MARKKKKQPKYKKSFTGDTGLVYPVGLSSQRRVRKSKNNYKMVSYGSNHKSAKSAKSETSPVDKRAKKSKKKNKIVSYRGSYKSAKSETSPVDKRVKKSKKKNKIASSKINHQSTKDKTRIDDYWVGILENVGIVLFDPGIQADESKNVLLFSIERNQMAGFDRKVSRGRIKKVVDPKTIKESEDTYKEWRKVNYS